MVIMIILNYQVIFVSIIAFPQCFSREVLKRCMLNFINILSCLQVFNVFVLIAVKTLLTHLLFVSELKSAVASSSKVQMGRYYSTEDC